MRAFDWGIMPDDAILDSDAARAAEALVPPDSFARCIGPASASSAEPSTGQAAVQLGLVTWEYDNERAVFTRATRNIEELTGFPRERFYTEPGLWPGRLHPEDTAWASEFTAAASAALQSHELEYRIIRADGEIRWVREVATLVLEPNGAPIFVRGVLTDITERKRLELETRQAAREFETVFGLLKGLYFRITPSGTIIRSSASMPGLLGEPLLQIEGSSIGDVLPAPVADAVMRGATAVAGGERSSVEEVLTSREHERQLLEVSVFRIDPGDLAAVVLDASERLVAREAEDQHRAQLKALANEIGRAADRERRRLAEEIHDRVSQTLAIARMKLMAAGEPGAGPAAATQVQALVEEAAREARALTSELAPTGLYELGLDAAIRTLCDRLEAQYGLRCTVDNRLPKDLYIDDDTLAFVFRAVREMLMNVIKHAGVDAAEVRLEAEAGVLVATVRDGGRGSGVDPTTWQPGEEGGFGLFSVLERAQAFGGDLALQSEPGEGTTAVLTVPVGTG